MEESKILRIGAVVSLVGVSRKTIYRMVEKGHFPRQVEVSTRCVGWRAAEIQSWLMARLHQRPEDARARLVRLMCSICEEAADRGVVLPDISESWSTLAYEIVLGVPAPA